MGSNSHIVTSGDTLQDCLKWAAKFLQVDFEKISHEILQYADEKDGLKFKIRAWKKDSEPDAASAGKPVTAGDERSDREAFKQFDQTLHSIKDEMAALQEDSNSDVHAGVFEEMLSNYENLDPDMQAEIDSLKKISTDETRELIEKKTSRNGSITVSISEDKMEALIDIEPPRGNGQAATLEMSLKALKKCRVVYGIDQEKIEEALIEADITRKKLRKIQAARGKHPEELDEDRMEILFRDEGRKRSIDGSRIDRIGTTEVCKVISGQLLARIKPIEKEAWGKNVSGEILKPDIKKEVYLKPGKNVEFDRIKKEYKSMINGCVEIRSNQISVRPMFFIDSDVDMNVGNVKFDGAIQINGCVRDGFSVEATDDIYIKGTVEGASVISKRGSIHISGGIAGMDRCYVSAGKNVKSGYIEHGIVYAGKSVEARSGILHSRVIAGEEVNAASGKGVISGGRIIAGAVITANTLGAPGEPHTFLILGLDRQTQLKIRELEKNIFKLSQVKLKIKKAMDQILNQITDLSTIPYEMRLEITEQKKNILAVEYRERNIQQQVENMEKKALSRGRGKLTATKAIYRKVQVKIGQEKFYPKPVRKRSVYEWDPKEMKLYTNRGVKK